MNASALRSLPDEMLEALAVCPTTRCATRPLGELYVQRADPRGVVTVMVDLDGLKTVNDTEGHEAGDRLLAGAAAILRSYSRPGDVLVRLGGDEFLVLCPVAWPADAVDEIESRFRMAFDGRHGVLASVGAAAGVDTVTADERMYAHKRARKAQR